MSTRHTYITVFFSLQVQILDFQTQHEMCDYTGLEDLLKTHEKYKHRVLVSVTVFSFSKHSNNHGMKLADVPPIIALNNSDEYIKHSLLCAMLNAPLW